MIACEALYALVDELPRVRLAVVGDFCLDVYWFVDPAASEVSLETGHMTLPVAHCRCSLGGAGNVAANCRATGRGTVRAFGAVGDDPWGREMMRLLEADGIEASGMRTIADGWSTLAYVKPHVADEETQRLDFGNFNTLSDADAQTLIADVEAALPEIDLVIVNQQVRAGIHTESFRAMLNALIERHPTIPFLVDSRHHGDAYPGACLKLNDHEAARLIGIERAPDALVLRDEAVRAAETIYRRWQRPVFVTRGARGCVVFDETGLCEIPGLQVLDAVDSVGAGDAALAGIALALAAGQPPAVAAELGGFTAGVAVRKLRQTGFATADEILEAGRAPDYVFNPELADDPRGAVFIPATEIEIATALRPNLRITHAIFDHDGTISSLRQGWEAVMEPMMVRTILGPRFDSADESLYGQVLARVRDYIDKSTGVQTLVQMGGLTRMVREFGCVPYDEILRSEDYKKVYNDALMEQVNLRLVKLQRHELGIEDFTIKNAVALLHVLHRNGVKLYLASGTDEADVHAEAEALGYADLFGGGIYGAVGDITREAKRDVLDRILQSVGSDAAATLVTFGDGPVEMRETRRSGGFCVGVASDEVRRYGGCPTKRARLIRAGADVIVPDFSQLPALLPLFGIDPEA
ncbi:MAG: carbohydrate kinase [Lentisphaerae bacterium]|nr:carbohydrate kinase [Lentisphaerota bacterium]